MEEITTLAAGIREHYQPTGVIEEFPIYKIAVEISRRGRIMELEQRELTRENAFFNVGVDRVASYSSSTDRALFRAIEQLERIEAERKAQASSAGAAGSNPAEPAGELEDPRTARQS
jgi:hypothetical protein